MPNPSWRKTKKKAKKTLPEWRRAGAVQRLADKKATAKRIREIEREQSKGVDIFADTGALFNPGRGGKVKRLKNFTGTVTRMTNGQVIVVGVQR